MTTLGVDESGLYDPWRDAALRYPRVHIEWHNIWPCHAGWHADTDVIIVDENITRAERRCALAHEIAHMDTGDIATTQCWFEARQETAADLLAARRLIDINHLANVMRWCDDPREVAEELGVTLNVLAIRTARLHPSERGVLWRSASAREGVA